MFSFIINSGSSSIKYQLYRIKNLEAVASGIVEKIGEGQSGITHQLNGSSSEPKKKLISHPIENHFDGLQKIVALLTDPNEGVVSDINDIKVVGHRVVHGGEQFKDSIIINDQVISAIEDNISLAPLHNPPNLEGIKIARQIFKHAVQVAVFDTSFHHTIPDYAYRYAIPEKFYTEKKIRRYGFHGTSHRYVAQQAAQYLNIPLWQLNLITLHLGNGASGTAIMKGKSVDTSMGMTPLEGLVMGTRSGDLDPAILYHLCLNGEYTAKDLERVFNKESGLKGLCGKNDLREILKNRERGDKKADLAFKIYVYRIKKYIGAYLAVLGQIDAIVLTAGIGENSPDVRQGCLSGLKNLGIVLDKEKNFAANNSIREIQKDDARIKILVVPTNEELAILKEAVRLYTQVTR